MVHKHFGKKIKPFIDYFWVYFDRNDGEYTFIYKLLMITFQGEKEMETIQLEEEQHRKIFNCKVVFYGGGEPVKCDNCQEFLYGKFYLHNTTHKQFCEKCASDEKNNIEEISKRIKGEL